MTETLRSQWMKNPTDEVLDTYAGCSAGYDFDTGEPYDLIETANEDGDEGFTGPCPDIAELAVRTTEGEVLSFCADHYDMYYSVMGYISTVEETK